MGKLSSCPEEILLKLLFEAPPSWKALAARQLLRQNPSVDNLFRIVWTVPSPWKARAMEKLWEQELSNSDLCAIIYSGSNCSEPDKARAWKELLERNCSRDDLKSIISGTDTPDFYKAEAAKILFEGASSDELVGWFIIFVPEPWKAKAWDKLLKYGFSRRNLEDIVRCCPEPYKAMAWEQFLKLASNSELAGYLFMWCPEPYKTMGCDLLLERNSTVSDLVGTFGPWNGGLSFSSRIKVCKKLLGLPLAKLDLDRVYDQLRTIFGSCYHDTSGKSKPMMDEAETLLHKADKLKRALNLPND